MIESAEGTRTYFRREWEAHQRDATRFLITMCAVYGAAGFLLGFVACAIVGAWT